MTLRNLELNDVGLVKHCYEHRDKLGILSKRTEDVLESLNKIAQGAGEGESVLTQRHERVRELWYNLLIDAVHALKVRDAREKSAIKQFEDTNPTKRTKARKNNAYGINELADYFRAFDTFEGVLYGSEPTYRDHVVHVVRVWLTGTRVLVQEGIQELDVGLRVLGAHTFDAPCQDPDERSAQNLGVWNEELWAIWTVVALCHDLGYPLEKTFKINRTIDTMLRHFGQISTNQYFYSFQEQHHALTRETLKVVSSKLSPSRHSDGKYTTQIQEKYHTKFARSLAALSHGIVSCLVLLQTLVYFLETDYDTAGRGELNEEDARQFQIRREILRAIASHTCTDIYHLKVNTPSFLLIMCDELQEWGRPTFGDMKLGQRPSDGACAVSLRELDLKAGKVNASLEFSGTADEDRVQSKFREFHKLLRPALADETRNIHFEWQIKDNRTDYRMVYDPTAEPFDELDCTTKGDTFVIYPDPQW
jgi:hypothetical protein